MVVVRTCTRRRERQKLLAVGAGQIGDRDDAALLPQKPIGERRDVAHVDAAADDPPALAHRRERRGNERADGREQDRGVERLGRRLVRSAGPFGAHRAGERLAGRIAGPGEGEHPPSLPSADLGDDVRGRAEAVEADRPPVPGHFERPPADQAGAKQRRGRDRIEVLGEREGEGRVGDRMGGEAAVAGVAGEERRVAQVLAPA